jgi:betaine-aldehyde dehydrogenase
MRSDQVTTEQTILDYDMYISGRWAGAQDGASLTIRDPATGNAVARVASGSQQEARAAVEAARSAFDTGPWPRMTPLERAGYLRAAAALVRERRDELARLETLQMGKLLADSLYDMDDVAYCLDYAAGLGLTETGEQTTTMSPPSMGLVLREPVGVIVGITPWNFPLLLGAWKFASALAAGNVFIVKPASISPLTTLEMARIFADVGLPEGVFQVVVGPGSSVGDFFCTAPEVDMVTLTGSLEVGAHVMRQAAQTVKKVGLELGGKSPNIVFADADREAAMQGALFAAFANAGQVCCAGSRLLVERAIHDEFVAELVARARAISVGPGMDPASEMGPLVSADQLATTVRYVQLALDEGAELACGGHRIDRPGYFFEPTVFTGVRNDMRIAQEEVFGPVLAVIPFDDEEEAVAIANDTIYGLAGGVWTQDPAKAMRVVRAVRAGTMYVNTYNWSPVELPWGGFKQSGLGRELGRAGMDEFTETKSVVIDTSGEPLGLYTRSS